MGRPGSTSQRVSVGSAARTRQRLRDGGLPADLGRGSCMGVAYPDEIIQSPFFDYIQVPEITYMEKTTTNGLVSELTHS